MRNRILQRIGRIGDVTVIAFRPSERAMAHRGDQFIVRDIRGQHLQVVELEIIGDRRLRLLLTDAAQAAQK